jgi:hypothetical protein
LFLLGEREAHLAPGDHRTPIDRKDTSMSTRFQQMIDALAVRGLTASIDEDRFGLGLMIDLEHPSQIAIADLYEAAEPGWAAEYYDLSGHLCDLVHADEGYDVDKAADAVLAYITRRNREAMAEEVVFAIERAISSERARVRETDTGTWVIVEQIPPSDGSHLMVATYPEPVSGVGTDGRFVTGWRATIHHTGQTSDAQVLYDAPANSDVRPLMAVIEAWAYGHTAD